MIIALLLAAAAPKTAVEAERAFAAMAQQDGQWTAFRAFATDDATIFAPQPVKAREFLKPLNDPPRAIAWSPAASFVSCDGKVAANTGPWTRPDGVVGYFSTIWQKQPGGGWKWSVDGGDELATPRPTVATPVVRRAMCKGRMPPLAVYPPAEGETLGIGTSPDGSLRWQWSVKSDGARTFRVSIWNGAGPEIVIDDRIAAPATPPKP